MIEISKITKLYKTRELRESDMDAILELCRKNPLFYEHTEAEATRERILEDMKATPPGIGLENKYFFGFYEGDELVAIMDLVDGYPDPKTAYIGFFMMNPSYQGKQVGTAIIRETVEYLGSILALLIFLVAVGYGYLLLADVIVKKSGKVGKENGGK